MKKLSLLILLFPFILFSQTQDDVISYHNSIAKVNDEFANLWFEYSTSKLYSDVSQGKYELKELIALNQNIINKLKNIVNENWDENFLNNITNLHLSVRKLLLLKKFDPQLINSFKNSNQKTLSIAQLIVSVNKEIIFHNIKIQNSGKKLFNNFNIKGVDPDLNKNYDLIKEISHYHNQQSIILLKPIIEVTEFLNPSSKENLNYIYKNSANSINESEISHKNLKVAPQCESIEKSTSALLINLKNFSKKYGSLFIDFHSIDADNLKNNDEINNYNNLLEKIKEGETFFNNNVTILFNQHQKLIYSIINNIK